MLEFSSAAVMLDMGSEPLKGGTRSKIPQVETSLDAKMMRFYIWNLRSNFQHGWTTVPIPSRKLLRCKGSNNTSMCPRLTICLVFKKSQDIKSKVTAIRFCWCFSDVWWEGHVFCWNFQWHSHRSSKTMICVFRDERLPAWVDMSWSYAWEFYTSNAPSVFSTGRYTPTVHTQKS